MIQFKHLRLSGFKSFVDKTELEVAPGLNGIVGPNGCGKSNLMEAMRWVMGEASAKRMRGGGMEDVIFNGTEGRTARNIAEVSLYLDNSKRTAPAAYNGTDEIEITRKIERDRGSSYKINGKNVRARDVQMLFADTVTGANSPALVSQGQVAKIISAKPLERRLILEESAGISGLYARRHEAELRLRAADANLLRIEDILGGMEGRLNALKRQARAAGRYRNLNAQIRQLEIVIHYLEYQGFEERIAGIKKAFEEVESLVADKMGAVSQLTMTQESLQTDLPALRKAEVDLAAEIQTRKVALQRIEDAESLRTQKLEETREQIRLTQVDQAHEQEVAGECAGLVEKLEAERESIGNEQNNGADILAERKKIRDGLEQKVLKLEDQYNALMQKTAETEARMNALEQQIAQNKDRKAVVSARKEDAEKDLAVLQAKQKPSGVKDDKAKEIQSLESKIQKIHKDQEAATAAAAKAEDDLQSARDVLQDLNTQKAELKAEMQMLQSFFEGRDDGGYALVRDQVQVDSGFEKAVSRALGDSLLASMDDAAPFRWIAVKRADLPSLPAGVKSIAAHIKVPAALAAAVSQIGFAADKAAGDKFVQDLAPGQSLVSAAGDFWRWDGYCVRADAADRHAMDLEYKNKLAGLEKEYPKIEKKIAAATEALQKARTAKEQAGTSSDALRVELAAAQSGLSDVRLAQARAAEEKAREESDLRRLSDIVKTAEEDLATLSQVIGWDVERLENLQAVSKQDKKEDTEKLYKVLLETRQAYQDAAVAFDSFQQKQNTQKARLHAIADERINLNNRLIRAKEREKALAERLENLKEALNVLEKQPKTSGKERDELLGAISELENKRTGAAEKLAAQENEIAQNMKALREAESAMSAEREKRAGLKAQIEGIIEQKEALEVAIADKFQLKPAELKEHITMSFDDNLDGLKAQKEKYTQERETIGPVNLRAEEEAQELEGQVGKLLHERNDLTQAIDELRAGIATINKEARERLLGAFEHVNAHFQKLFTQLFGGGKAHLALVEGEEGGKDPLSAGLEIYAQPPGKTLQSLSLLSGGEQTLASIALIFAMFLTNPSPICVLDEIDAPLDDANVERVCDLLDEIAERGQTRFLIITHHRLTMARMDRLYGVTMSEKGVSQLVSVDLQQSFSFLEAA